MMIRSRYLACVLLANTGCGDVAAPPSPAPMDAGSSSFDAGPPLQVDQVSRGEQLDGDRTLGSLTSYELSSLCAWFGSIQPAPAQILCDGHPTNIGQSESCNFLWLTPNCGATVDETKTCMRDIVARPCSTDRPCEPLWACDPWLSRLDGGVASAPTQPGDSVRSRTSRAAPSTSSNRGTR